MAAADESAGHVAAGTWFDRPPPPRIAAPSVVHRLEDDEEDDDMPKGHYDRSKAKPRANAAPTEPTGDQPELEKPARKPRKAKKKAPKVRKTRAVRATRKAAPVIAAAGPRFGVFEDGSVQIATAECTGRMSGEDAAALVAFIGRLKGK